MTEDQRNVLSGVVFKYLAGKNGRVFIYWHQKLIKILAGEEARKFLDRINGLEHHDAQLLMAKVTGHFKHGNER